MKKGLIASLLLLLFFSRTLKAEFNCIFDHLSTEDGLSHGSVSSILKDRQGFMWFATWDGVNRYDGSRFKIFKTNNGNTSGFSSNRIETMCEDALGNIWVRNYDAEVFRFNRYREKLESVLSGDSLTGISVSGLSPVSSGDVWLATANAGAFRVMSGAVGHFTVEHYTTATHLPLPGNEIRFIQEDSLQQIWINTNGGIVCFNYEKSTHKLSLKDHGNINGKLQATDAITAFYSSGSNVFLGTKNGSLLVVSLSSGKIVELPFQNKQAVTFISGNGNGLIYIGTSGNGLFAYNENLSKITEHYQHPYVNDVLKFFVDSFGLIWVETKMPGYSLIDPVLGIYKHFEQELDVNQELKATPQCGIKEDVNHTIWLMLKGGGFGYYNRATGNLEYFYNKPGDPQSRLSNYVTSFCFDSDDVLWLSTYFKGIEKVTFQQPKFRFVQPSPQVNFTIANEVRAMMEDSKGLIWVATKKQELFLMNRNFEIVKHFDKLLGEKMGMIYAMAEDASGNIYLGTKGNGMFQLSRTGLTDFKVTHFTHDSDYSYSLSNNNIYTIFIDSRNRIWVGTYGGGLNQFEKGRFIHAGNMMADYPMGYGAKVRMVTEDASGNLWIATTNGIVFLNENLVADFSFQLFSRDKGNVCGLAGSDVYWIFCDKNGQIWVTTLGGGLAKLKSSSGKDKALEFETLTKENGLPGDVVFTIVGDRENNLWMSTGNGISCYNVEQSVFLNYNRHDGIVSPEFSEAACAICADGRICFGANNGFYCFSPSNFKNEQKKVNLILTGFTLLNKPVSPGKGSVLEKTITETSSIKLNYNQNVFSFTWAGLDFSMQDKIRYQYRLDGFDSDWQSTQEGEAAYTKLRPGKYTFTVRYENPELQQLNTPKSLTIEIRPPFWKTTWAFILYLLLVITLVEIVRRVVTTMIRLRNKVLVEKELSEVKLNFFTNISHELRTPLTLILGPVKALNSEETLSNKGKSYTGLIEQNARRLLRLVNQLLDFRKIQTGKMELTLSQTDMVAFVKDACSNFDLLAKEKQIDFSFTTNAPGVTCLVDEEKMDSVIFNLLSNAFKFTPDKGKIEVSLTYPNHDSGLVIVVKDNGVGVDKAYEDSLFDSFSSHYNRQQTQMTGTGIGLSLSKELVQLHGGDLNYKPTAGGGATFEIRLKTGTANFMLDESVVNNQVDITLLGKVVDEEGRDKAVLPMVLLVEDNSDLRHFLRLQLDSSYRVEEAANGVEALTKALKLQPDIILTDVMMPEMDGIELLDRIKNDTDTSHIPVVILTARSSVESKIEGLKYGADAYLTKPFNIDQLKAQLANLLNQRVVLRQHFMHLQGELLPGFHLSSVTDYDADFLNKVSAIIEENMANTDFRVEDIYKNIGMGRSKFFDKMKGLTGQSPIDFIREYRLEKAVALMESGNYNITEVSYLSGFADAGYFSKCFKERFGVPPSQYGKDIKK